MPVINRSLAIVIPKQPFLDWCKEVFDEPDLTLESLVEEPSVYLLPDYDTPEDLELLLEAFHDLIFENELIGWYTDESAWPKQRDLDTFKNWFEVAFSSMVTDLADAPLEYEDWDD